MEIKEMTNEELLDKIIYEDCPCGMQYSSKAEFLSRLEAGEKALDKLEKLEEMICHGAPLMWAKGEYIEEAGNWEKECMRIIREGK